MTPDQSDDLTIFVTGSSNPTNITFAKSGNETTGDKITIQNVGSNPIVFVDQPGILELDGTYQLAQGGILKVRFNTDRWYQDGLPANATQYTSGINLSPYGLVIGSTSATVATGGTTELTALQMNGIVAITEARTARIPAGVSTGISNLAAATLRFHRQTTAAYDVESAESSDRFVSKAGDEYETITLDPTMGAYFELVNFYANKWQVTQGTVTDGGSSASCNVHDYYTDSANGYLSIGRFDGREYGGTVINPDASIDTCQIDVYVNSITGSVSSKDYYLELWSLSTNSLNSRLAVSSEIDGSDITTGSWVAFTISATVPHARYAVCLKAVADGAGSSATATYDGSNYITIRISDHTNETDMANGLIALEGRYYWADDGAVYGTIYTEDDVNIRVYGVATP